MYFLPLGPGSPLAPGGPGRPLGPGGVVHPPFSRTAFAIRMMLSNIRRSWLKKQREVFFFFSVFYFVLFIYEGWIGRVATWPRKGIISRTKHMDSNNNLTLTSKLSKLFPDISLSFIYSNNYSVKTVSKSWKVNIFSSSVFELIEHRKHSVKILKYKVLYSYENLLLLSLSFSLVAKSFSTLVTPWTVACQAPLSMGFSRQEYWSGLPFPSPGDLPESNPGLLCRQILYQLS